jgi:hypothetical protein
LSVTRINTEAFALRRQGLQNLTFEKTVRNANAKKQELPSHGSAPQLLQCFLVSNYADCAGFAGYAVMPAK